MLILLSLAKSLNFSFNINYKECSIPLFEDDAFKIIQKLQKMGIDEISKMMNLSKKLSKLNFERYRSFKKAHMPEYAKPAILTFSGDVYQGLNAANYSIDDLNYVQNHLGILSGLYGYLRPMDLIQAYRLEMGTPLCINSSKNLYEFWSKKLVTLLIKEIVKYEHAYIINLASKEYFKAVNPGKLKAKTINIDFKEDRNGKLVFISFNAKKARGLMASFIIKNRLQKPEELCNFNEAGYSFDPKSSTELNLNFKK